MGNYETGRQILEQFKSGALTKVTDDMREHLRAYLQIIPDVPTSRMLTETRSRILALLNEDHELGKPGLKNFAQRVRNIISSSLGETAEAPDPFERYQQSFSEQGQGVSVDVSDLLKNEMQDGIEVFAELAPGLAGPDGNNRHQFSIAFLFSKKGNSNKRYTLDTTFDGKTGEILCDNETAQADNGIRMSQRSRAPWWRTGFHIKTKVDKEKYDTPWWIWRDGTAKSQEILLDSIFLDKVLGRMEAVAPYPDLYMRDL